MNLGFIGGGNMATALIRGAAENGVLAPENIHVYDIVPACSQRLHQQLGVAAHEDCKAMIAVCDMLVLAVKPNVLGGVLETYKEDLLGKGVISIAAGWTVAMLKKALGEAARILRVMPNTPALCGQGMTALSLECTLTYDEKEFAQKLFSALGRYTWLYESLMEASIGVSGSAPAYVYMFIEALADAGVEMGLTRKAAQEMAAQAVKGAAEMVLTTGRNPGALKDDVCSPGGTTIQAVRVLEEKGLRAAVMNGALAAYHKAVDMKD